MADLEAQDDGVEEQLEPPPPQDNQLRDEVQPGRQPEAAGMRLRNRKIPIVSTLESEPDLPPNWNGTLPPAPGGLLNNLPPLPPSLDGRASSHRLGLLVQPWSAKFNHVLTKSDDFL